MKRTRATTRKRKCPDCSGTGYLDGPKVERIDAKGGVHRYTSLVPCKCYKASASVVTDASEAGADHAMRAANDREAP